MIEEKIESLGLKLPDVAKPAGTYIPAIKHENLVFTSGQIPISNGEWLSFSRGKIGGSLTKEQGYEAAKVCALNALSAIKYAIGNLDEIETILKVVVYVSSEKGFVEQAFVANGVSNLLNDIFGDSGKHVRAAIGVSELPLGCCVEVEIIASIKRI